MGFYAGCDYHGAYPPPPFVHKKLCAKQWKTPQNLRYHPTYANYTSWTIFRTISIKWVHSVVFFQFVHTDQTLEGLKFYFLKAGGLPGFRLGSFANMEK